jgi:hypothetical protein
VLDARVLVPLSGGLRRAGSSTSEESGVVDLDANDGRSSEDKDGDGGRGMGGLL